VELVKSITLAFAGGIGSGKSSLGTQIADKVGWPYASFGDYVRGIARERGLDNSREVLQAIGAELMTGDLRQFCSAVIRQSKWVKTGSVVLDGVRHREVLPIIRELTAPARLLLVFVVTPREVRRSRLEQRSRDEPERLDLIEAHSTEVQIPLLEELADLRVDGTGDIRELVNEVVGWLGERFSD